MTSGIGNSMVMGYGAREEIKKIIDHINEEMVAHRKKMLDCLVEIQDLMKDCDFPDEEE
jgi:hypothetical protein